MPPRRSLPPCFLGSILLEPRRWQRELEPELRLAEWIPRIREAGFVGIELWENHWRYASAADRELLQTSGLRFIFNSYASLSPAHQTAREHAAAAAHALGAEGIKFNFSPPPADAVGEVPALQAWARLLPPGCRLLCECHADTAAQTPAEAARVAALLPASAVGFILHPFFVDDASAWSTALGSRAVHWHVQVRAADNVHRFVSLESRERLVRERLQALAAHPPESLTFEFTQGVGEPKDHPEQLLPRAEADRRWLERAWAEGRPGEA